MHHELSADAKATLQRIDSVVQILDYMFGTGLNVVTPFSLCLEIVDQTIDFTNFDQKILDPACGKGSFLLAVIKRFIEAGCSVEQSVRMVYGVDNDESQCAHARVNIQRATGVVPVIDCENSLVKEFDMNFDAIVGNPPFEDSNNDSTYTNLWAVFYKKAFAMLNNDGVMAMVTPKTWATPKDESRSSLTSDVRNIIKNHAISLNIDECKRHFTVGSTFSYSIVTKQQQTQAKIKTNDSEFDAKLSVFCENIIKDINPVSLSIMEKFRRLPIKKKETGCSLKSEMISDKEKANDKENLYPYPVQYAMSTRKWAKDPHRLQYSKKVVFPNQNTKNYPYYDDGIAAPSNRGAVFLVDTKEQGENLVHLVKLKAMQFVISQQRFHHGLLNTSVVSNIPDVDLTRTWTDEELYEHFGLTQEEIDYIEATVK